MRIAGAGWVSATAYGAVGKRKDYAGELRLALKADGVLTDRIKNAGKFDEATNRAFCAAALALHDAGFSKHWKNVALIGTGSEECTQANRTYFEDYAGHGRQLARANLFIYTLPTSPLAEIAIHFKLDGPLFYTSEKVVSTAHRLLASGDADAVLALWAEQSFTAALLFSSEDDNRFESFQSLKTPEQLIHAVQDHFPSQRRREGGEYL
jgi:3-oxoacyl-(acyl-carrier-protein) synthase